jgi:hypothetical protein
VRYPAWLWLALVASLLGGWRAWAHRAVTQPAGVLAPDDPEQTELKNAPVFDIDGGRYRVLPLAHFQMTARVLSREDYWIDRLASLVPTDVAFGWGDMSDSAVLSRLDIEQDDRWYRWSASELPVPREDIEHHSANMHLIPADRFVRKAIGQLRPGQVVSLSGELVEVRARSGWTMRSSLTRDDTGAGACELVWVERLDLR